ncbi:MAG: HNH endonuclease [Bacteroidales bacterium]|nr:HNH endonuclease [Bacteroidales bacterium]
MNEDGKIRLKIFEWLSDQIRIFSNVLDTQLLNSFVYLDERIFLQGSKGIWKPKQLQFPISIASDPEGKYSDGFISESMLHYSYEGTDPNLWTNLLLREAMMRNIPLIYLQKISKGKYFVHLPVYIIKDEPDKLRFTVAAENVIQFSEKPNILEDPEIRYLKQEYVTREVKQRMYQQTFRELVLDAYKDHCAICSLRHRELLDAAHIKSDAEGGKPLVTNGLSLCKIHHSAFDQNILGINPDYIIEVRRDVLEEIDGPMLKYGIQEMHGNRIILPHSSAKRPDRDLLAQRYEMFKKAI